MKSTFFERLTSKKKRLHRLKNNILEYFSNLPQEQVQSEEKLVLEYLKTHDISVFPYEFANQYNPANIDLFKDSKLGLFYMIWEGKKLFYKNGNKRKAQKYFNGLLLEQDARSPHRYLTDDFNVSDNDVVLDIGAAEGNFALSVIEKSSHIFLFEPDEDWTPALKATFAPWGNKVTIVNKIVTNKVSNGCICLDDFISRDQPVNFIKVDVEGWEAQVIQGGRELINQQKKLKMAVCTYHNQADASVLSSILKEARFDIEFSDGYMIYYYGRHNEVQKPYLRKAILRATRK